MPEQKKKTFPENFYWGEPVRGTVARPCQIFLEVTNRNIDKVYRTCKVSQSGGLSQEVASYFKLANNSDNLNSICKMQRQHI